MSAPAGSEHIMRLEARRKNHGGVKRLTKFEKSVHHEPLKTSLLLTSSGGYVEQYSDFCMEETIRIYVRYWYTKLFNISAMGPIGSEDLCRGSRT